MLMLFFSLPLSFRSSNFRSLIATVRGRQDPYWFATKLWAIKENRNCWRKESVSTRIVIICHLVSLNVDRIMHAWYWSLFVFEKKKKKLDEQFSFFKMLSLSSNRVRLGGNDLLDVTTRGYLLFAVLSCNGEFFRSIYQTSRSDN